jgi:hypothetical protein
MYLGPAALGDNGGFLGGVRQRWGTTGGTETLGCRNCVALEYDIYQNGWAD